MLQKRAVRIVSKEAFDAHTDPVFKVLKILKFEKNYLLHLGTFMYSYKNNLLPRSFDDSFLRLNDVYNYSTRNSKLYYAPFCRTKIRQFTVNYQGPTFFNTLHQYIRDVSTASCFQSKLIYFFLCNFEQFFSKVLFITNVRFLMLTKNVIHLRTAYASYL